MPLSVARRRGVVRGVLAAALILLAAAGAAAQGYETEELGEAVRARYQEAGRVVPTVSWPASHRELRGYLVRLSGAGQAGFAGREPVELHAELTMQPAFFTGLPTAQFREQLAVEDPLGILELGMGRREGAWIHAEGVLQREWRVDSGTNVPVPQEGNILPFENNLLREGTLFLPVGPLDLAFGRQDLHLGPDELDSLSVSRRIPFLDALRATLRLGPLKMTSVTSTLENGQASPDVAQPAREDYGFNTTTILYNIHYFEYAWEQLRLGLGSQVVIAREDNSFQLGDFFPVFSWHNADITPNNMSLVGDVTAAPLPGLVPGLELFLQYGYDDISGEAFGFGDSEIPTIDAYIGGLRYRWRLEAAGAGERSLARGNPARSGAAGAAAGIPRPAPGLVLQGDLLAGYTHYLWGAFDDTDGLARAIWRLEADGPRESMPLTSPYGPGALWFRARAGGEWTPVEGNGTGRGSLAGELSYRALGRIPGVSLYTIPYAADPALEGAARVWEHRLRLALSWESRELWRGMSLGVTAAPELRFGAGAEEVAGAAGVGIDLTGVFRFRGYRVVAP